MNDAVIGTKSPWAEQPGERPQDRGLSRLVRARYSLMLKMGAAVFLAAAGQALF